MVKTRKGTRYLLREDNYGKSIPERRKLDQYLKRLRAMSKHQGIRYEHLFLKKPFHETDTRFIDKILQVYPGGTPKNLIFLLSQTEQKELYDALRLRNYRGAIQVWCLTTGNRDIVLKVKYDEETSSNGNELLEGEE